MQNRSSTWSIVLAFSDGRSLATPRTVDPIAWARASALDTIDAVSAAVEPANLLVLSDDEAVRTGATEAGAHAREQGRDLNAALTAALADWVRSHPERSGAVLLGPLPYADGDTISALLRACAATESAVVVSDDGGSVAISHHDPARLAPRFGGSSAGRHQRVAVSVGSHLTDDLARHVVEGREPVGSRTAALERSTTKGA